MKKAHRKIVTQALNLISQGWQLLEEVQNAEQSDFDDMTETGQLSKKGVDMEAEIETLYDAVTALQSVESNLSEYEDTPLPARFAQVGEEV
jgi:hypothetical protein